jgi:biopolymer transport protein ExbB/TolQ
MTMLLQGCMVVVTLAIASIAVVVMRAMGRFEEVTNEFKWTSEVVRDIVTDAGAVTRQLQELALSIETAVPPLKRAASRVEELSDRAVSLTRGALGQERA